MQLHAELEQQSACALAKLTALAPLHIARWQAESDPLLLQRALAVSPFVAHALLCQPELISWLFEHKNQLDRAANYQAEIKAALIGCQDEAQLMRQLRQLRRQEMLWIAWQDIAQQLPVTATLTHLTALADALILGAYDWLYAACCRELGTPCDKAGTAQPMLILGMGKLGGGELNFSSDIDLIFCYPHNGETVGARRSIANAQFFTRLGQRLIKVLDQQTADGFCYRVDMRLRPFGDSGPLAMSFGALEDYYQEQGRDWERYAMIKARVLGDESAHGFYQELKQMLHPFVFRRYLDFGAIIALRRMKSMIQAEVRRRGLQNNIKLGAGGIRQIEFIVQVFQLMRGGREPSLRQRGLLVTLDAIAKLNLLTANEVASLKQAYILLRRVENLLQAIDDKQTQTLPQDALNQERLVLMMQAPSWQALAVEIAQHMQAVHEIFVAIIGEEQEGEQAADCEFNELWQGIKDPELALGMITECQPQQAQAVYQAILDLKQELTKRTLGQRGREVLNQLIPRLVAQIIPRQDCVAVFERVFKLIVTIATRTTYLELLNTHNHAVTQLVNLCALSPMVAGQLAQFPILLDELLDSDLLYQPTAFTEYRHQLLEFVARIPEQDMEQQMEIIRQFKQTQLLKIAAADIGGNLALMRVSDHLTYLAEAIIDAVINQAWLQMSAKYGTPSHLSERDGRGFAVIGYGKLGGIELGYGSDLDLVFLHDCPANSYTTGAKQIDGEQFYLRLVQRIIHLFSTRTATGVLYEIDTRLRPSGASGLLVTTLEAFANYQQQEAWVWEHQALVRARVIYGDSQLTAGFDQVRRNILTLARDKQHLAEEVVAMREKMRQHLLPYKTEVFDLKQGIGGITDLEFMVQYWVLAYSHEHQNLVAWPDNIRILEQIAAANIISHAEAQALIDAYICLRNQIHHLALRCEPAQIAEDDMAAFAPARSVIMQMWQQKLASLLPHQA